MLKHFFFTEVPIVVYLKQIMQSMLIYTRVTKQNMNAYAYIGA